MSNQIAPVRLTVSGFVLKSQFPVTASVVFRVDGKPMEAAFVDITGSALGDGVTGSYAHGFRQSRVVEAGQAFGAEIRFLRNIQIAPDKEMSLSLVFERAPGALNEEPKELAAGVAA